MRLSALIEVPAAEVVEAEPVPEEPKTFTYDEFLAKKRAEQEAVNSAHKELLITPKEVRAVEKIEGLKTTVAEETVFMAANKVAAKKVATKAATKATIVDVGFKVAPSEQPDYYPERAGRGGGRGRGEGRGRGDGGRGSGRGESRPPRTSHGGLGAAIDVFDASSFPSL